MNAIWNAFLFVPKCICQYKLFFIQMGLVKENAGRITYSILWKCFACVLGKLNANPSKSCRVALSQRIRQAVFKTSNTELHIWPLNHRGSQHEVRVGVITYRDFKKLFWL